MRIVTWNCSMALHRKTAPLLALEPDIAVVCECAEPDRLRARGGTDWLPSAPVWIGQNPHKGLAVLAFNGYTAELSEPYFPTLRYIAPVRISGPTQLNLLAVWAQNASGGVHRKHQLGPLRRALGRYRTFLLERPAVVAGDLNDNIIWDKPGWRHNYSTKARIMERLGLVSAYHTIRGEVPGMEITPTHYWRDRKKDGPTYHIDYVFIPSLWIARVKELRLGTFEDWCGSGLSDHVPIIVDIDV